MVRPSKRRMRRRERRSPTGKPVRIYKRGKPRRRVCALCAAVLHGVPKARPSELRKVARSGRAPTRLFAGVLCGNCVAVLVKEKTRLKSGFASEAAIPLAHLKFLKQLKK